MKTEQILEIAEISDYLSPLLLLIFFLSLTIFMAFKSGWLFLAFACMTVMSGFMLTRGKYKIRHIRSTNKIIKQFSSGHVESIILGENGSIELQTIYKRGRYLVVAYNDNQYLELLVTISYSKAKSLTESLECATKIKAKIGPHLFKLDPAPKAESIE